jgi:hypothetical protein
MIRDSRGYEPKYVIRVIDGVRTLVHQETDTRVVIGADKSDEHLRKCARIMKRKLGEQA